MLGSPPAGPVHTSPTVPDRPTRAADERAEPDPVVAIATSGQTGASGCAMTGGERTILPDLRAGMELARGAFCDLDLEEVLERAVDGESDLEVILGPVAKPGRAVVSAHTPAIEREHDWTGTSG